MFTLTQTGVVRRVVRTLGLFGFGVAAAQCSDRATLDPNTTAGHARLSIQPQFARAPGGPTVTLSRVHASLIAPNGDSTVANAAFLNGSATLHFEIPILGGPTEFLLNVEAFDTQNVLAYKFSKKIIITPGEVTTVAQPTLDYVAPDAAVTKLIFSPPTLQLNAGASGGFTVTGTGSGGQPISPLRLAFTSKDPSIATVDPNTGAVTAGPSQGSTYIIAHTVIGVVDSALVKVHAPVDKVILAPAAVSVIRGKTTAVAAELRDAGNHLIDDRTASFTSADPTIATVSQSGVITGVAIGKTTITASAEDKTATTAVTVTSPVDHIELTPQSIQLGSIGETMTLAVKIVPVAGASVDGLSATFSSSNPSVASVDGKGVVKAVGGGTATITADVDGNQATTNVTVKQVAVSIAVQPHAVSVAAIGATQAFTATALDALGAPVTNAVIDWTSSDPTIATVDSHGVATALRAGSTTITATVNGKSDVATFIVAPVVKMLIIQSSRTQIATGETATLSAKFADANGGIIRDAAATFTTTTPNVGSLSGNVLTGLSPGTAHVTATANGFTGSLDIRVVPGAGTGANVTGRVIDGATSQPIAGATIVSGNSNTTSAADGSFTLANVSPDATINFAANGYVSTQYFDANNSTAGSTQLGNIPLARVSTAQGFVGGAVRDASSGNPINNGTVNIRAGINNLTGAIVATSSTSEGYSASLPAGTYTATASAQGFASNSVTVAAIGNGSTHQDINLVPNNGLRITLTWGAGPCDLDAHLFGPTAAGHTFHVFFDTPQGPDGESLDTDAIDGFGPENITVPNPLTTGTYRFYVQRYSSCENPSVTMASGGATVTVTLNGKIIGTFHPPADPGEEDGAVWAVFSLTGSTITPIGTIIPTGCSGDVQPDGTSLCDGESFSLSRTLRNRATIAGDVTAVQQATKLKKPKAPRVSRAPGGTAIRKP